MLTVPGKRSTNAGWLLSAMLVLAACGDQDASSHRGDDSYRTVVQTGVLENPAISEASGLARSIKNDHHLWVINDGGSPATLYAIGHDGSDRGEVALTNMENTDWEDLASFEFDGNPMLLIADVGDNLGWRDHVNLYVVEEPDLPQKTGSLAWQVSFRYPDGPRDAEAVAVDSHEGMAYLLSKRTVPAELYRIPLYPPDPEGTVAMMATYLGAIESLPMPTQRDLDRAPIEQDWYWQPTAMDFSADGKCAVIVTYRAVYLYSRLESETWLEALQRTPQVLALDGINETEAVTLANDSIFVTVEAARAPIYRIYFSRQSPQEPQCHFHHPL